MRSARAVPFAGLLVLLGASMSDAGDRVLRTEMVLDAPPEAVWEAWTTEEGVKSFFAPGCNIELRVDGLYEIFFFPVGEPGHRGADGMRILVLEPGKRLSFTWNAPMDQEYVRAQRTIVTVELEPQDRGRTRLRFTHAGWGTGEEWDRAYDYFDAAWNRHVLPRLRYRFENGPADWSARPELPPVATSLKTELAPVEDHRTTGGR